MGVVGTNRKMIGLEKGNLIFSNKYGGMQEVQDSNSKQQSTFKLANWARLSKYYG